LLTNDTLTGYIILSDLQSTLIV